MTLHIEEGTFQVLNQVGKWDGDKFKKWDGTYVQNDFVNAKGKTYYFGEDGVKVTGWKEIALHTTILTRTGHADRYVAGQRRKQGLSAVGWQGGGRVV